MRMGSWNIVKVDEVRLERGEGGGWGGLHAEENNEYKYQRMHKSMCLPDWSTCMLKEGEEAGA
jgi:hypothetical protein